MLFYEGTQTENTTTVERVRQNSIVSFSTGIDNLLSSVANSQYATNNSHDNSWAVDEIQAAARGSPSSLAASAHHESQEEPPSSSSALQAAHQHNAVRNIDINSTNVTTTQDDVSPFEPNMMESSKKVTNSRQQRGGLLRKSLELFTRRLSFGDTSGMVGGNSGKPLKGM